MREMPTILHLDLDAFFAAVEQRDKPSLRGKPVVVGGLGPRGVVATASYEARVFGIRSAMPTAQARARCSNAAYLAGRFPAYRAASEIVMTELRTLSDLVEPLSLDEAFVDLTATMPDLEAHEARQVAESLRERIRQRTGGLTASVGVATSKLIAKMASDHAKPDGVLVVPAGAEFGLLHPQPIRAMPGIGPVTAERIHRLGVRTIGGLAALPVTELIDLLGTAHGQSLHQLAHARDDRPVVSERESKSISVEDTFDHDLTDRGVLDGLVRMMADRVTRRMVDAGLSARTVTLKARLHDFTTMSRSASLPGPTDDTTAVIGLAVRLLDDIDHTNGIRLLGVGLSGFSDWVQDDLFSFRADESSDSADVSQTPTEPGASGQTPSDQPPPDSGTLRDAAHHHRAWVPGADVVHTEHGPGWVWGSGSGRVTVRFETADTPPGPVRTFSATDPALSPTTEHRQAHRLTG